MVNSNRFLSKIKHRRKQIVRTVLFFIFLRALHGISILAVAYFLGWDLDDIKEFTIFGFKVYFLILAIVAVLIIRRFYKIYKWWTNQPETT